jgi:hypothetical protein
MTIKFLFQEGIKMTINEYGFLGKDIKHYEKKLDAKYKEVFDFYEEINHFLHKVKFGIELKNDDFQGGAIIGIFYKSLTTFQSIYILFKHYLCNNAENLCRILFEEIVNIGYCSLGKDETRRYLSLQTINKLRLINIVNQEKNTKYFIENYKEKFFEKKSYNKWKSELVNYLHSLGVKEIFNKKGNPVAISLEERIKKVNSKGIMNYYLTFYKMVSAGVHSSPEALERYFIFDENKLMKELYWGPIAEKCEIRSIFAAIHFMIISIEYIHKYFNFPKKEDISKFWKRTLELGYKYQYTFENIE